MKINLFFILLNIFVEIQSLVELPAVEDNNIAITVIAIQNTLKNLLASFKIQTVKHSAELNQYFTIHNLFVSITLRDCDSWKKIASLSKVIDIDNKSIYFITQINEVLNEGDNGNAADDIDKNMYVERSVDTFIGKLKSEYLKERSTTKTNDLVNREILNNFDLMQLKHDAIKNNSKTNGELKNTIFNDEFWQPGGRRIYKGSRTNIKDFPFMASVQFFKRFQCAGSIIKSDLVITAASCLQLAWNNRYFRENPAYLTVQIGSHFYEHGGEIVEIQEIYFHPDYDPKTLRHNLALMRLSRKIAFQTKSRRVKKIDIDRKAYTSFGFNRITIVGWGARDRSNVIYNVAENKLSYAKLDFFPLDECQEYYSKKYVTNKNFCAGFYSKGSGACNRDVGGPGVVDGTLVGVISFASPVCGAPGPTVFTKVGYYSDWIDEIMKQDVPSVAMATTELQPKMYYKDIFTKRIPPLSYTPFGNTPAPWETLRTNKDMDDLRTGKMLPILSNEKNTFYHHMDTTSKLSPKMTIIGYNVGGIRTGPSTITSESNKQMQVTPKIRKKKHKSKSTVTTTVRRTHETVKQKKVKFTSTVGTPLEIKMATEPLLNKVEKEDVEEDALEKEDAVEKEHAVEKEDAVEEEDPVEEIAVEKEDAVKEEDAVEKEDDIEKEDTDEKENAVEKEDTVEKEDAVKKEDTVEKEDAVEKALVEIINNLDIDRIVQSIEPSKLGLGIKRKKKPQRGRKTTKQNYVLGITHVTRFLL